MFTDCFFLRFPVTQLFGCEPPSCHHQNPSSVIFLQFDSQSSSVSLSHRPTLLTVLSKPLRDCHHTDSVCVFQRAPCFHGVHKPSHKSSHNVVLSGLRILRAGPGCLRCICGASVILAPRVYVPLMRPAAQHTQKQSHSPCLRSAVCRYAERFFSSMPLRCPTSLFGSNELVVFSLDPIGSNNLCQIP